MGGLLFWFLPLALPLGQPMEPDRVLPRLAGPFVLLGKHRFNPGSGRRRPHVGSGLSARFDCLSLPEPPCGTIPTGQAAHGTRPSQLNISVWQPPGLPLLPQAPAGRHTLPTKNGALKKASAPP